MRFLKEKSLLLIDKYTEYAQRKLIKTLNYFLSKETYIYHSLKKLSCSKTNDLTKYNKTSKWLVTKFTSSVAKPIIFLDDDSSG